MDKIIKNILKQIENEGYEAYIVGGFVRDKLLKINTYDVDICTNALPVNLRNIFKITQKNNGYGGFNIKIKKYNIDITTYRKEIRYDNRKPVEVEYISSLFEDIKRRDFTINSLCMDKNDNIIDLIGATEDINKRIVRVIGDANEKFSQDPLRMLRAIRFATILNFNIEQNTYKSLCLNSKLTSSLSGARIKEELSKILSSKNYQVGLDLLKETNVSNNINLKFDKVKYTDDLMGMWAQIICDKLPFSKTELDNISRISQIIKKGSIDEFDLFNNGLYLCLVAGQILEIPRQDITKIFNKMPIKSMKSIEINGEEIIKLLKIKPCKRISEIINDVKNRILAKELKNNKTEIKKYILEKWQNG
ncbi:MAG: hypothetical protein IKR74_00645 [Bacilli bacterium]|nr:hypothetical protein [Bacilli bacterium]